MPATVNIPSALHQTGSQTYGPVTLDPADDTIEVQLDRTPNQGLNARAATVTARALFEILLPGDPTWHLQSDTTFAGGTRTDPDTGAVLTTDSLGSSLTAPGTAGRQLRLTLTVAGNSVRLAGTILVT